MKEITPRSTILFGVTVSIERGSKNEKVKAVGRMGVMPLPFVRYADVGIGGGTDR